MINATHYVLDLETMGTGPNAAIVAIGCVEVHEGQLAREFYQRVELADAIAKGGEVTALTVEWWLKQSEAARAEVNGTQEAESLWSALGALRVFMAGTGLLHDVLVWGNGPSFDNVILASAYRRFGGEAPWPFWNDRDLRTLTALYPAVKDIPFEGTRHHALHDARHEARQLIAALEMHQARAEPAPAQSEQPFAAPEGYALVPQTMQLDKSVIEALLFHVGGVGDAEDEDKFVDGVLWVGEVLGDDGEREAYGLNIACAECLEEGSTNLIEFAAPDIALAAPVNQAADGGRNPRYEGLFEGETEQQRTERLASAQTAPEPELRALVEEIEQGLELWSDGPLTELLRKCRAALSAQGGAQ